MERKPIEKWIAQGKKNCKNYLFYEDKVLDLSDFILQHPGGLKAIKNYVYKDITNILFEVYPHQRAPTLSKLMKYQVGLIPENEATNARHKLDKSPNFDRPKEKKKVCFFQQDLKSSTHQNTNRQNEEEMKRSMKRSTVKNKENMKESTQKSKPAENMSKSKSKGKKKDFVTSIRIIGEQKKTYEDYFEQNQQKVRQKQRANTQKRKQKKQKPLIGTFSFETNQLDEEKPNFRVPILFVKSMNRNR